MNVFSFLSVVFPSVLVVLVSTLGYDSRLCVSIIVYSKSFVWIQKNVLQATISFGSVQIEIRE